jgi:hypothetical protein
MSNVRLKLVHSQPESIDIPITPGELLDRLTLLELESERLRDTAQRMKAISDWSKLAPLAAELMVHDSEIAHLKSQLRTVNETLKEIDSELRKHERRGDFGPRFIALARAVYRNNDQRTTLRQAIDARSMSGGID